MLAFLPKIDSAFAIENPLSIKNNKMGVHILFTSELSKASSIVNANGGDWGYVTIPIQSGDKDLEKWQKFMDDSKKLHVTPIIRLATEGDYFDTSVWRKPTKEDILDFVNFLNSLEWPVKNKYIIVFNEVNRADEWEGNPDPNEYSIILNYAVDAFKSLDNDFFIISAGLDNAAENIPGKSMNEYDFLIQMESSSPGIFGRIDGLGSHSYPNPGFSVPPWIGTKKSISSFKYEMNLVYQFSDKVLPVFITETGWSREKVPENQISSYFTYAFEKVWSDHNVVAITPFLLQAGQGPFFQFSLLNEDGTYNEVSKSLTKIPKNKGEPTINVNHASYLSQYKDNVSIKTFPKENQYESLSIERVNAITPLLRWLLRLEFQ